MQKQFEDVFKQISAAAAEEEAAESSTKSAPKASSKTAPKPAPAAPAATTDSNLDDSFQETIRRTMERMQASGEQATAAAASGGSDDFMSEMLKQLSSGELGGEGSEEEFSKMLMGMMEQLTNKEILYEPMKELDDKFPDWLAKNRDKTPKEDLKRYEEQQVFVREIVAKFEEKTYSDSNAADRELIVDRMQKVRSNHRSLILLLTNMMGRCKQQDRLPLIWLEIWHQRRKSSMRRMSHVTLSKYQRLDLSSICNIPIRTRTVVFVQNP